MQGDVVLWHARMVHSGGVNRSAHMPGLLPVIRMAIPIDYQRDGFTFLDGEGVSPSGQTGRQWHVSTRQFLEDTAPPLDMWRDWAI